MPNTFYVWYSNWHEAWWQVESQKKTVKHSVEKSCQQRHVYVHMIICTLKLHVNKAGWQHIHVHYDHQEQDISISKTSVCKSSINLNWHCGGKEHNKNPQYGFHKALQLLFKIHTCTLACKSLWKRVSDSPLVQTGALWENSGITAAQLAAHHFIAQ